MPDTTPRGRASALLASALGILSGDAPGLSLVLDVPPAPPLGVVPGSYSPGARALDALKPAVGAYADPGGIPLFVVVRLVDRGDVAEARVPTGARVDVAMLCARRPPHGRWRWEVMPSPSGAVPPPPPPILPRNDVPF